MEAPIEIPPEIAWQIFGEYKLEKGEELIPEIIYNNRGEVVGVDFHKAISWAETSSLKTIRLISRYYHAHVSLEYIIENCNVDFARSAMGEIAMKNAGLTKRLCEEYLPTPFPERVGCVAYSRVDRINEKKRTHLLARLEVDIRWVKKYKSLDKIVGDYRFEIALNYIDRESLLVKLLRLLRPSLHEFIELPEGRGYRYEVLHNFSEIKSPWKRITGNYSAEDLLALRILDIHGKLSTQEPTNESKPNFRLISSEGPRVSFETNQAKQRSGAIAYVPPFPNLIKSFTFEVDGNPLDHYTSYDINSNFWQPRYGEGLNQIIGRAERADYRQNNSRLRVGEMEIDDYSDRNRNKITYSDTVSIYPRVFMPRADTSQYLGAPWTWVPISWNIEKRTIQNDDIRHGMEKKQKIIPEMPTKQRQKQNKNTELRVIEKAPRPNKKEIKKRNKKAKQAVKQSAKQAKKCLAPAKKGNQFKARHR